MIITGTYAGQSLTDYCPKDIDSVLAFQAEIPRLKKKKLLFQSDHHLIAHNEDDYLRVWHHGELAINAGKLGGHIAVDH